MTREVMLAALNARFVPALHDRGFTGALPHLRRIGETRVDVLSVQFDQHGGGFVINIARCPPEGVTTSWGKHIPASKVTPYDVHVRNRQRLHTPPPGKDGRWLRYDDGTPPDRVADAATSMLVDADRWWALG